MSLAPPNERGERIRAMFGRVAPRYDLLNHLLSGSLDVIWRRRLARELRAPAGAPVLDLCSGTGDQATALARRGYGVVAADFCLPMLERSRGKFGRERPPSPTPVQADALVLPFTSGAFAGATVSFGLRNVSDLDAALRELHRVLVPGGRLGVLEFAIPRIAPVRWLYVAYFRWILPLVGRIVSGDAQAYAYLPDSVFGFPQREGFLARLREAGFAEASSRDLSAGILCLYLARKPE